MPDAHDTWEQVFTDEQTELFRMVWQFSSAKTLEDRFNDAVSQGEPVTWTVTRAGSSPMMVSGVWRWSSSGGGWPSIIPSPSPGPIVQSSDHSVKDVFDDELKPSTRLLSHAPTGSLFSSDDGCWAAGGFVDGDDSIQSSIEWGHCNLNSNDAVCSSLYMDGV